MLFILYNPVPSDMLPTSLSLLSFAHILLTLFAIPTSLNSLSTLLLLYSWPSPIFFWPCLGYYFLGLLGIIPGVSDVCSLISTIKTFLLVIPWSSHARSTIMFDPLTRLKYRTVYLILPFYPKQYFFLQQECQL